MKLVGRKICAGRVAGQALVSPQAISFYGGVDPDSGQVVEKGHPLQGQSVAGKILVFPQGKGSTVGSYALYRMKKTGVAPLAIVNQHCEPIVAVGAIISEIPCVDSIDIEKIKSGGPIEVDAGKGTVTIPD